MSIHRSTRNSPQSYPSWSIGNEVTPLLDVYSRLFKVKKFFSGCAAKIAAPFTASVPKLARERFINTPLPTVKTDQAAFDKKHQYIIYDGDVYFKPIAATDSLSWRKLPLVKKALSISADGNRLIICDKKQQVLIANTDKIQTSVNSKTHKWTIERFQCKWRTDWFHLPGFSPLANFLRPASLHTMHKVKALAVSHKGDQPFYYEGPNRRRHQHPLANGTTIYMLNASGNRIFFADSRLPNKFQNEITGPEKGRFKAEALAASGSILFLLKRAKDRRGREIHKLYTRYADLDSLGGNPLLPSHMNYRFQPHTPWKAQPNVPLSGAARLTDQIAVVQTGAGMKERELRILGTDAVGNTGYWCKPVSQKAPWKFQRTDEFIPRTAFLSKTTPHTGFSQSSSIVEDYRGEITIDGKTSAATLKDFSTQGFGERGLHTRIETTKNRTYSLHATKGWSHLFGLSKKYSKGVLTPENPTAFNHKTMTVVKEGKRIIIKGSGIYAWFSRNKSKPIQPMRPMRPVRWLLSGSLVLLDLFRVIFKVFSKGIDRLLNKQAIAEAQARFSQSLRLKDNEDTQRVLQYIVSKDSTLAPRILVDFLRQASVAPHLQKMMKGANIQIQDPATGKRFFKQLKNLRGAKQRPSSHPHKKGTSYGVECPLFGELLFWQDQQGHLRLQFEAHSLKSLFKIYCHGIDFVRYRLQGRQQGLYGSSKHTDAHPVVIPAVDFLGP